MKRNKVNVRAAVIAAIAGLTGAAHGDILLGVGDFGTFSVQGLYSIDTGTGAATLIGPTGLSQIADIAWDPTTYRLLAITVAADLYEINTATGASTLIAGQAGTITEGALTFDSAGQLFASRSDQLHTVNQATGALTAAGLPMGAAADDISGMAFWGPSLIGYSKNGAGEDSIVLVNTGTGIASTVGLTGIIGNSSVGGLATNLTGTSLYLTDGAGLYTVNVLTGAASPLGSHGFSGFSGIAVIPSPSAVALAAITGVIATRRRRRVGPQQH